MATRVGTAISAQQVLRTNVNRYLLLRPRQHGEQQPWRRQHMQQYESRITVTLADGTEKVFSQPGVIPFPPSSVPVLAEVKPFPSFVAAQGLIASQWEEHPNILETRIASGFKRLITGASPSDLSRVRYGLFGLFTGQVLQSVHALVPMLDIDATPVDQIPLVALFLKAPWSRAEKDGVVDLAAWQRERFGVEFSVLVHAIRTYYTQNPASFGDATVAAWTLLIGDIYGDPLWGFSATQEGGQLSDLLADLILYGFVMPDRMVETLIEGSGMMGIHGITMSGEAALRCVMNYNDWIDVVFGAEDRV